MSSISSVDTITPRSVSPSISGPIQESTWSQSEASDSQPGGRRKGKEKQTEHEYLQGPASDDEIRPGDTTAYPPINDNEAETRRVEENLRRWEVAERQRRKLAREAASNIQGSPSLISGVSRRVSQLWPEKKRSRHTPNTSLGTHVALQSQENLDGGPTTDYIDTNQIQSPLFTPTPSPRPSSDSHHPDDPFSNPPDESLSPFADSHRQTHLIKDSFDIRQPTPTTRIPPTPKPLGLPPPRTPPPPGDTPRRPSTPVQPTSTNEDIKPTRWWHDWLCGCSEGPDRGGEYQAGRTNPYE